jgi:Winged helix DNA-binding domain
VSTVSEVLHARLATQRLLGDRLADPAEVVTLLAAVQSQEFAHALWSLRLRSAAGTEAQVRAAFDRGEFLRTHVLRPTWHLVAPEDIGWLLQVTAPRVQQLNGTIYRQHGLDQAALDRAAATIADALAGGVELTRAELGGLLGTSGIRLAYQVMNAELEGLIVSGAMRGAQHTYALLTDRVPPGRRRSGDLSELAFRFYAGHGPASEPDLARWATLTRRQAAEATAAVGSRLAFVELDGERLWFTRDAPEPWPDPAYGALLLPLYDELTLSYPTVNFPVAEGHPHSTGEDLFVGCVVIGDRNVGLWRRTVRGGRVVVEVAVAPGLSPEQHQAVRTAAAELAGFLDRELELTITGGGGRG